MEHVAAGMRTIARENRSRHNRQVTRASFAAELLILAVAMSSRAGARLWSESETATAYSESAKGAYQPTGGTRDERSACEGRATVLELVRTVAKVPQHDVDLGRTRLILREKEPTATPTRDRAAPGGKVLLDDTLTEVWECLAYNPRTRRYVITSVNEHGVKVSMRGLVYVDEAAATFKESVFGRRAVHAVASLYQPASGFLALIGTAKDGEGEDTSKLYVLDTDTDELQAIGVPPRPPPIEPELRKDREVVKMSWRWDAPERHYTELDEAIWSFVDPTTLRVSYGRDTVSARAKRRTERRWDLKRLFRR
jgi:hypothetical protein